MQIHERLKQIRLYRRLSQEEIAGWLGITKQAYGRKERGEIGGFTLSDIELVLSKVEIDARWLFGQISGEIETADLRTASREYQYNDLVNEVRELRQNFGTAPRDDDPVAQRVRVNAPLREHVEMIQFLDAGILEKINVLVFGWLQGRKEAKGGHDADVKHA